MSTPTPTSSNRRSAASYIQNNEIDYENIKEGHAKTLSDISDLQNIELELFSTLNDGIVNKTLTTDQKEYYTQKINEISQMRINLYKNLNHTYDFYNANVKTTRDTIAEQAYAIDVVEKELNESKRRLSLVEEERDQKRRMVEITRYYSEKYEDHSNIMKSIVYLCIPLLLLAFLKNRGFITMKLFLILFLFIIVLGLIIIGRHIIDSNYRDTMVYDEYAIPAPATTSNTTISTTTSTNS